MSMFGPEIQNMIINARDRQRMDDFYAEPLSPIPGMPGRGYSAPGQFTSSGAYGRQAMGLLGGAPVLTPAHQYPQMHTGQGLLASPAQQQPRMIQGFFGSNFQMPPQAGANSWPVGGFLGSRFRGK